MLGFLTMLGSLTSGEHALAATGGDYAPAVTE
jgi:hypothetical protein